MSTFLHHSPHRYSFITSSSTNLLTCAYFFCSRSRFVFVSVWKSFCGPTNLLGELSGSPECVSGFISHHGRLVPLGYFPSLASITLSSASNPSGIDRISPRMASFLRGLLFILLLNGEWPYLCKALESASSKRLPFKFTVEFGRVDESLRSKKA